LRLVVSIFFERKLSKVVFPAPDPPIIASASPVFTLPETFESKVLESLPFLKQPPLCGLDLMVILSHFNSREFLIGFLFFWFLLRCVFSLS